jgi:hypothetical protein
VVLLVAAQQQMPHRDMVVPVVAVPGAAGLGPTVPAAMVVSTVVEVAAAVLRPTEPVTVVTVVRDTRRSNGFLLPNKNRH